VQENDALPDKLSSEEMLFMEKELQAQLDAIKNEKRKKEIVSRFVQNL
jgi:hypothetical protein